ncbi:MAG: beta-ketoacyl synthase N-terminal-like domain-containing protein [Candidatus Nanopelagicales bacterium]
MTSDDSEPRIAKYRDLERRYAGPGAELHIVRANLASFNDVDALLQWLTTSTTETVGTTTTEVKPALWPTLLLPFAAGPAVGSLADTGPANEVTLRLMLLSVQRLIGSLGERIMAAGRAPVRVLLPMSPNHGTFGGDGSYSDTKSALETVMNRWAAEQSAWAAGTRLIALTIGWVRGTGLMAGNDALAHEAEQRLGIHTFSSEEMGALVAAACSPVLTAETPLRLDLSGGLSQAEDISGVLRGVTASATETPAGISALPNLADEPSPGTFDVDPRLPLNDMAVIVSIAELGPWGGSGTRWQAELGELSADAIADLAWRMGLVRWDREGAAWLDSDDQVITEADLYDAVSETVSQQIGVREFSDTGDVAADGTPRLAEVYLRKPLTIDGVDYPAGTAIRVPDSQPLKRKVGGQFPHGVDPVRHGLEPSVAAAMDPLAAWNLVVTAEALAAAGISAEELNEQVHPCLIGNVQGTGMGGMNSLHRLYVDPLLGTEHANDLLQEALGNVVSAHVNQSLIGGYGPMVHPVAACATAAVSLEEAVDKIRLGKADVMVAGGWDDLSSEGINGFADMAATADNQELLDRGIPAHAHSRPGDKRRRGFVESQGGGSFLVVRGSVALRLGLPVRAVVAYAGSSGDGIHTSIPAPGLGALGVARGGSDSPLGKALAAHGLEADDIAVVSKHDTSTAANDPNEAMIHDTIQRALGRSPGAPLRVISQKSLTGHAKGGAAAWQLAGLCDVFATGVIPGNRNLVSVDPQVTRGPLVVDYRNLRRAEPVRAALLTSLGFGHVSAVVALAHPAVFLAAVPQAERERYLTASRQREQAGRQHLLGARYGRTPVLQRRTERPDRDAEIDLLIGARA